MAAGVGVAHKECCDCYKVILRTTRDNAVVTIWMAEDHKCVLVETWVG